jgi:hypothetical protein
VMCKNKKSYHTVTVRGLVCKAVFLRLSFLLVSYMPLANLGKLLAALRRRQSDNGGCALGDGL